MYARAYGSGLRPEADAVPVSPEARAEQGLRPAAANAAPPVLPGAVALGAAAVAGFVLGRTPLKRLAKTTQDAIPTAVRVRDAMAAADRFRSQTNTRADGAARKARR